MTLRHNAGYLTGERGEAVEAQCLNHIIVGKGAFRSISFQPHSVAKRKSPGQPLVTSTLQLIRSIVEHQNFVFNCLSIALSSKGKVVS